VEPFLETSVLVATFHADHQHHLPRIDLFLRYRKSRACCAAHSLAEVYATLTGMHSSRPVYGDQALLFLGEIRDHLTLVTLTEREYFRVVEAAAVAVLAGGAVYDASLGQCPVKADAEAICTWNTSDSLRAARADTCTVTTADRV
jgi:predicted nucleic acid-binding protein